MQIKIDWRIIIFVLFFFILKIEYIYILFLFFTIIHEIFHMITGILVKFEPTNLSITLFGTQISFKIKIDNYNKKIFKGTICSLKKIMVYMAGPISNLIIASIFYIQRKYDIIIYINLILAIVNLIPIYPLDGGRILKQTLILLIGRRKALKYTNLISNIMLCFVVGVACIFTIFTKIIFIPIGIIYLIYLRIKLHKIYMLKERAYKILEEHSVHYYNM